MTIDRAMGYELASGWLPDFLAYHERPQHPDAEALLKRAEATVTDSYTAYADSLDDSDATNRETELACAADVIEILHGVAAWLVADRAAAAS